MIQVNWKAAAIATGATALAGVLTSPAPKPSAQPVRPHAAAAPTAAARTRALSIHAANIEEQTVRLAARLRPATAFARPERDAFHFGLRNVPASPAAGARARAVAVAQTVVAPLPVEPPPFPYRLSGVASDVVDGQTVRTAVLSGGPTGLVLATLGETVGGTYRVEQIDDGSVRLIDVDGRVVRLAFLTP